ncbi:MAG: hypothetical protein PVH62_08760 [Anaerolineae bacterium]
MLALTLPLTGGLVLAVGVGAGWNDPRPAAPATWQSRDELLLRVPPPGGQAVHLLDRPVGSFTLEATAAPLSSGRLNGYGLAFRAQDSDRYAVFAVSADGYLSVVRMEGHTEVPLLEWHQFPHIRRGRAANRLRLSCAGGTCHFWVNDEYAGSLPDDMGPAGDVGLWASRLEGGEVRVAFTQVAVWERSR